MFLINVNREYITTIRTDVYVEISEKIILFKAKSGGTIRRQNNVKMPCAFAGVSLVTKWQKTDERE